MNLISVVGRAQVHKIIIDMYLYCTTTLVFFSVPFFMHTNDSWKDYMHLPLTSPLVGDSFSLSLPLLLLPVLEESDDDFPLFLLLPEFFFFDSSSLLLLLSELALEEEDDDSFRVLFIPFLFRRLIFIFFFNFFARIFTSWLNFA